MNLNFFRLRLTFLVPFHPIHFPQGAAANVIRGALGDMLRRLGCSSACLKSRECTILPPCAYRQIFSPVAQKAPSGLAEPPRPFVLRAASLNDLRISPGGSFSFDIHLFLLRHEAVRTLVLALSQLAQEGLGPARGSAVLRAVCCLDLDGNSRQDLFRDGAFTGELPTPLTLDLSPRQHGPTEVEVRFVTPTELKGAQDPAKPEFAVLIARLRDRISALRYFYGEGALSVDFRGLVERARQVSLVSSGMQPVPVYRRSSRTGQVHSIGGWTGTVRYAGELAEFLPYLYAGQWTGVGRQTVWGNGELLIT